ncbi:MAG: pyridoxal-phosphate dependent enzyme [Gammaproteobacteria bacterium]|nr:pyridoxal-phosphate dependent enzyme [Gammaproteobacteria bacterium]
MSLGLISNVEDRAIRQRAVDLAREKNVVLPTFSELAEPWRAPADIRSSLDRIAPDEAHPANLFRINWYNDRRRQGFIDVPLYVELPESFTGVPARIVVALGFTFPMIGAHKVLPAYACLAPRLVSGLFDPTRQRAIWASTGNYCRGGLAVSNILGCHGVAVLPTGMSQERFDWLEQWVRSPEDIIRTPGTEANVKEIYDKCAELAQDPLNEIVNQFSEFGNYLCHWRCTGPALERVFDEMQAADSSLRLAAYVSASGSSGTLAAGDYLKEKHGTRIAVVEAVECPTLLKNGYGDHNIQGIGDKHVPLIHNVMNTDVVIGVTDKATDGLNAVFNTDAGRQTLQKHDVPVATIYDLPKLGLSSIANVLGAIKLAKEFDLGPQDVIVTVATDSASLYESERQQYIDSRYGGDFTVVDAAEIFARYLIGADTKDLLETTHADRERIFNLGYFTWVEQQGVSLEDFDCRKDQGFWHSLQDYVPIWDEMIAAFNRDTGLKADKVRSIA